MTLSYELSVWNEELVEVEEFDELVDDWVED